MLVIGWPVTLAVDLAVVYVVARIIFGAHPVVPFLLLLGIACDGFGFVTLALLNPAGDVHLAGGALILAGAIGLAVALREWGVRSCLAVRLRRGDGLLAGAVLGRPAPGARARADHAVPAARGPRSGILG